MDSKDNQVNKEQTEEGSIMEFYLGQYVNYIEPLDGNFEMSLDQIAYERMGGITDELSPEDFPVYVNKDLTSYCRFEWLKKRYIWQLMQRETDTYNTQRRGIKW